MRFCALAAVLFASVSMFGSATNESDLRKQLGAARTQIDKAKQDRVELQRKMEDLQTQLNEANEIEADQKKHMQDRIREQEADGEKRLSQLSDAAKAQNNELYRLSDRSNETIWAALFTSLFGFLALLVQGLFKIYQDSKQHQWQITESALAASHRRIELEKLKETKDSADRAAAGSILNGRKLDSIGGCDEQAG